MTIRKILHISFSLILGLSICLTGLSNNNCFCGQDREDCHMKSFNHEKMNASNQMNASNHQTDACSTKTQNVPQTTDACSTKTQNIPCSFCFSNIKTLSDITTVAISSTNQKQPNLAYTIAAFLDDITAKGNEKELHIKYHIRNTARSSPIYLQLLSIIC